VTGSIFFDGRLVMQNITWITLKENYEFTFQIL